MKSLIAALLIVGLVSLPGCASNSAPTDVQIATVGVDVLKTATALQKGITVATESKLLPVPLAQQLTGYNEQILQKSGPLGTALKAYHSLTDPNAKRLKAADLLKLLGEITSILNQLLATPVPEGFSAKFSLLSSDVVSSVAGAQLEVSKALK